MTYYLLEKPNPHGENYYKTRRAPIQLGVIHITAGLQGRWDKVDTSAEQTALYAAQTDRKVSWHSGSDTDSWIQLLPDSYTAFHVVGYNSKAIGHEISKRDDSWANEDPHWVSDTLTMAAAALRPRYLAAGIPFVKITKRQADLGVKGIISHAELDPERRTDPGPDFPWDRFIKLLGSGISVAPRWLGLKNPPMYGQDVLNVQAALKRVGYKGTMRPAVYDRGTANGVKEFQDNRGFVERGVGPVTMSWFRKPRSKGGAR